MRNSIDTIEWYFIFFNGFFYAFSARVKWPPSQVLLGGVMLCYVGWPAGVSSELSAAVTCCQGQGGL